MCDAACLHRVAALEFVRIGLCHGLPDEEIFVWQ